MPKLPRASSSAESNADAPIRSDGGVFCTDFQSCLQRRSLSALQVDNDCGTHSAAQGSQVCHCGEAEGRRGALSAKREEVPLGCNLGKAAAISPMVFLLFGMCREIATSASGLLAMTNLGALCQKQCSACCKPPWRSPSAPKNTEAAPLLRRLPTISGEIDKGQSSAWKFCPLHAAFPQRSGCPLPFGRVAHGRNK